MSDGLRMTLWVQSCVVYSTYYHYSHQLATFPTVDWPNISVDIPGLPTLRYDEIVSFLHSFSPYADLGEATSEQFKKLSKSAFCVLVDSFEELEYEVIESLSNVSPIKPIGPLVKFPCGDEDSLSATDDSLKWLDTQPIGSVVYVSFGSIVVLEEKQIEEIAWGLLNSGPPFLWAIKPSIVLPMGFIKEAEVYGVGVRLGRGELNTELLSRDDVERSIFEVTRGPKSNEMKKNAMKLKKAAEEAITDGGSFQRNLQAFVEDIRRLGLK
ncbi:hypothetical protein GIB67_019658 [Kingdonia uniflora]|uniref:Uncharacterized protein n=1 Tax=Kingdonia uniflora TaxID=39325 RepID=A0A7J7P4T4_9MAGN|nr:hypothetical protein GIB67_019658 [Kingdonia uniflora]